MDVDYGRVAVVALLLAVNLALVGGLTTSSAAYGPYNDEWDGASTLRSVAGEAGTVHLAVSTDTYETVDPERSVAVVLAPGVPSERAATRVRSFLARGGRLVVAGENATATNAYLAAVGASARVDGRPLVDDRNNTGDPRLPVAANVTDHPLTEGVERVALNYGTSVDRRGATALVNTSGVAYLDANENGTLDDDEPLGPLPVATVEAVGDGRVVTVSDPSVFTNAMVESDNRPFVAALVADRDAVVLDYSQGASLPPLVYALVRLRASAPAQAGLGLLAFAALGVYAGRRRIRAAVPSLGSGGSGDAGPLGGRGRAEGIAPDGAELDGDAVRALLADRHPEWDADRVERVTEAILRRRGRGSDDD